MAAGPPLATPPAPLVARVRECRGRLRASVYLNLCEAMVDLARAGVLDHRLVYVAAWRDYGWLIHWPTTTELMAKEVTDADGATRVLYYYRMSGYPLPPVIETPTRAVALRAVVDVPGHGRPYDPAEPHEVIYTVPF